MFEEDFSTFDEGSIDRRLFHLDRTPLSTDQTENHDPKRSSRPYRPSTDFCPHPRRAYRSMSVMYEYGGEEYMESDGSGQAESHT